MTYQNPTTTQILLNDTRNPVYDLSIVDYDSYEMLWCELETIIEGGKFSLTHIEGDNFFTLTHLDLEGREITFSEEGELTVWVDEQDVYMIKFDDWDEFTSNEQFNSDQLLLLLQKEVLWA